MLIKTTFGISRVLNLLSMLMPTFKSRRHTRNVKADILIYPECLKVNSVFKLIFTRTFPEMIANNNIPISANKLTGCNLLGSQ